MWVHFNGTPSAHHGRYFIGIIMNQLCMHNGRVGSDRGTPVLENGIHNLPLTVLRGLSHYSMISYTWEPEGVLSCQATFCLSISTPKYLLVLIQRWVLLRPKEACTIRGAGHGDNPPLLSLPAFTKAGRSPGVKSERLAGQVERLLLSGTLFLIIYDAEVAATERKCAWQWGLGGAWTRGERPSH